MWPYLRVYLHTPLNDNSTAYKVRCHTAHPTKKKIFKYVELYFANK